MLEILKDNNLKELFKEYVTLQLGVETLNFYDECIEYEQLFAKNAIDMEIQKKGLEMIERFAQDESPNCLNLPYNEHADLLNLVETKEFTPMSFDSAKKTAFKLLKTNFYVQFRRTLETNM